MDTHHETAHLSPLSQVPYLAEQWGSQTLQNKNVRSLAFKIQLGCASFFPLIMIPCLLNDNSY